MSSRGRGYYYGSYGIVRGYGKLCRTLKEATATIHDDWRQQRANGGSTDRVEVVVTPETGLCWRALEDDESLSSMEPVKTASGEQARYTQEAIRATERLWEAPKELPGWSGFR